jgi:DNA-directed RNA polymerase specialized sigma24 family protein
MRKGWRVDFGIYKADPFLDVPNTKPFKWNFPVAKEDLPVFLSQLLDTLPKRDREIVTRKVGGETFRSIAKDFPVSYQMVHKIYHRAVKKLREGISDAEIF